MTYDDGGAWDLCHFTECIVVVVIGWAEVWLASGQPGLHLDIKEPILHTESLFLGGKIFYPSFL